MPAIHKDVMCLLLALALILGAVAAHCAEPVHLTFGTRAPLLDTRRAADSGSLVVELANGDMLVAGYGASRFTDVGDQVMPMLARADRAGRLLWSRVYDELPHHQVLAVAEHEGDILALTRGPMPGTTPYDETRRSGLFLIRVPPGGGVIEMRVAVGDLAAGDAVARELGGQVVFLVAGKRVDPHQDRSVYTDPTRLFAVSTDATVQQLDFPDGFTRVESMTADRNSVLLFLGERRHGGRFKRSLVASTGASILWEVPLDGLALGLPQIAPTPGLIYLVGNPAHGKSHLPLLAYRRGGQLAWCRSVTGFERRAVATPLRDGGVLLSGTDGWLARVSRLSDTAAEVWSRRFASAREKVHPVAAVELVDGAVALTGSTSAGGWGLSSGDSDAFLMVSDGSGDGFAAYSRCAADAEEIRRLRERLLSRLGATVWRAPLTHGRAPQEPAASLGEHVPRNLDCGDLSEHYLLDFLEHLEATAESHGLQKPSERTVVQIIVYPDGAIGGGGYREGHRSSTASGPSVEIEAGSASAGMRFLGEQVLPYTERSRVASSELRSVMGVHHFSFSRRYRELPPFAEETRVVERFLATVLALPPEDRQLLRSMYGDGTVAVSVDPGKLHLWGPEKILVGRDRVDDAVPWLLHTLPALRATIGAESAALEADVHLRVRKSDVDMSHEAFLLTLRQVAASSGTLTIDQRNVLLKTRATIDVSGRDTHPMRIRGYARVVTMRPDAAGDVLSFVIDNAPALQRQELRD